MKIAKLSPLFLALSVSAFAKDVVVLEDNFAVPADARIVLDVPVGEIELRTHDGDTLSYRVEVEEANGHWFSSADLNDVKVKKEISGDRVRLEIDEDDTEQHWVIAVPRSAAISIDLGVGSVEVEGTARDLDVDVGVGSAHVELTGSEYRSIELEAGVGGASLRGFENYRSERAIVSEEVSWRGNGQYDVKVEVGVGDVTAKSS
ncbi:hypothetical protein P2G88_16540 [Aliiglaciecola sp. CAU 1673]|uniref:hypothetical protein n=1 Tax=Aliiglaciecola sp. CAU 1673 TaxID=3032595 RepID=UPI0023DCD62D|nr:hypothetical protein [Aliiglaciecola sp. CAU 1673]MDF2179862.1 hypothetical protein [Aliiglaciecola sp. CAU 1673]